MNVYDIVKNYLKENGYDGLAGDGCGCSVDELAPCEHLHIDECKAAHKRMCSEGCRGCALNTPGYSGDPNAETITSCVNYPPEPKDSVYIAGKKEEK